MTRSKSKSGAAGKYHFEGKDLEYFNALMKARAEVSDQMRFHSEELDCSNADKRGVTTHMADISSDNSATKWSCGCSRKTATCSS